MTVCVLALFSLAGLLEQGLVESVQASRSRTISSTLVEQKLSPNDNDSFLEVCYQYDSSNTNHSKSSQEEVEFAGCGERSAGDDGSESKCLASQPEIPESTNISDKKTGNGDLDNNHTTSDKIASTYEQVLIRLHVYTYELMMVLYISQTVIRVMCVKLGPSLDSQL